MGASGTTTVDFGSFPGSTETSVDVGSQSGLVSGSEVEAWLAPVATSDHSVDEHVIERIRVIGRYLSDGNIRIHAFAQPLQQLTNLNSCMAEEHRLYGQFTVGWVWA